MGRKLVFKKKDLYSDTAIAASFTTDETVSEQVDKLRYVIEWANGSSNDFDVEVQFTLDNVNDPTITPSWFVLPLPSTPSITTASGNHVIDLQLLIGKAHRLSFTRNAGQADIDVSVIGTTLGA